MKYSIVIPVYNTEKYVSKALESLKNQTYKDIEVVIVNDGSTDNSESVILDFKKSNPSFNLVYKKKWADQFYVQWETMKEFYPDAIYKGGIY